MPRETETDPSLAFQPRDAPRCPPDLHGAVIRVLPQKGLRRGFGLGVTLAVQVMRLYNMILCIEDVSAIAYHASTSPIMAAEWLTPSIKW
jgi:hypothetical protein